MLRGVVFFFGGVLVLGVIVYLLIKTFKLLIRIDSSGRFRVFGLCFDGKSILKIIKVKFVFIRFIMFKIRLKVVIINAEFKRVGISVFWGRVGEEGWIYK